MKPVQIVVETIAPAKIARVLTRAAPLVFFLGISHLGYQITKHWDVVTLDFRFFWLAGEFWERNLSPYTDIFALEAAERFQIFQGAIWYYTPNWHPIARLYAVADPLMASRFMSFFNGALLLMSCGLNAFTARRILDKTHSADSLAAILRSLSTSTLFFLLAGAVGLSQAAGNTLHLGQSSMLIYFGASLLLFAIQSERFWLASLGLFILMLKPQIGLIVVCGLLWGSHGRRIVAIAAALSIAAATPAFFVFGPVETAQAILAGAAQYNVQAYNLPPAMTGIRHLLWQLTAIDAGTFLLLAAAMVLTSAFAATRTGDAKEKLLRTSSFAFASALLFTPLHVYDFVLAGALVYPAILASGNRGLFALASFALLWRAGNLPQLTFIEAPNMLYYPGSLYASLTALIIFIAFAGPYPRTERLGKPAAAYAR